MRPTPAIERFGHGRLHEVVNRALLGKANLVFGGMNIDIHLVIRNGDKEGRDGILPFHQSLPIPCEQRVLNDPVAHMSAVDENKHAARRAAKLLRIRHPSVDSAELGVPGNWIEITTQFCPQDIGNPVESIDGGRPALQNPAVVHQTEIDLGSAQCDGGHDVGDMSHFGGDALHEFSPGRCVEKQVLDRYHRTRRRPYVGNLLDFSARNPNLGAGVGSFLTGNDCETRHRRDAGQCFTPEPKTANRK